MSNITSQRFLTLAAALILSFSMAVPAHASGGGDKAKVEGPIYVDFKNIVVPVIKKNGRTGVIALSVMAEVKDQKAQTQVSSHLPKLRDAFIRVLYGSLDSKQFTRQDGNLDIENIKTRLMKTAELVMKDKENPIQDILFQNITQQTY